MNETIDKNTRIYIYISDEFKRYLGERGYDNVYLIRGKDRCINMFTNKQWVETEAKFKEKYSLEKGWFKFSMGKQINLKEQDYKYIPISKILQEWSGIEEKVVFVCWPNRTDIWAKELFPGQSKGSCVFEGGESKQKI